jgi:hypothetical protein
MNLTPNADARSLMASVWSGCVAGRLSRTSRNRRTAVFRFESDNPALHSAMSEMARLIILDTSFSPSLIKFCSIGHYNYNFGKVDDFILLTSVAMVFPSMSAVPPAGTISVICSSLDHGVLNVVKNVLVVEGSPVHWTHYGHFLHLGSV